MLFLFLFLWTFSNSFRYYRPKLKDQMQYCVDHPEEINQIAKVKAQVSEVKGVMMQNIEKVWNLPLFPLIFMRFCLLNALVFLVLN